MTGKLRLAIMAMLAPVWQFTLPASAEAQDSTPTQLCMALTPASGTDASPLVIVMPPDQEQTMASRGYVNHPCSDDPEDLAKWRTQICYLADISDTQLQGQITQMYNATPAELCSFANAVSGSP